MDRTKIRWNGWGWTAHADALATREDVWRWLSAQLGMPSLLATPARPLEDIALPPPRLEPDQLAALADILGADRVRQDAYERAFHALGRSYHDLIRLRGGEIPGAPDAVLYPRGGDEVMAILDYANANAIAVVPFGGGTGPVGGANAAPGPFKTVVTIDLSGMDRILEIDSVAGIACVEAGIYGPALEKNLAARGLTLGHFPQCFEFSTLGGWIAHKSAGDWLAGAKMATPSGWLMTGNSPASGPDLNDIVSGSEGAFGVITEASIRLRPLAEREEYRGYIFPDFAAGLAVLRAATQAQIPFVTLQLSDAARTRFDRDFAGLGKRRGPMAWLRDTLLRLRHFDANAAILVADFSGGARQAVCARKRFGDIARKLGGHDLGDGPGKVWQQERFHAPYLRDSLLDRGVGMDMLQTMADWSKLPALYAGLRHALDAAMRTHAPRPGAQGLVLCQAMPSGPCGARLDFTFIFPRTLDSEIAQWRAIKQAAMDAVLAHGGGLQGAGEDHRPWMAREKGEAGIEVLRGIKRALDPKSIMNPGKLIPD